MRFCNGYKQFNKFVAVLIDTVKLLCIYDAGDRRKTIRSLRNMKRYLMYDEDELRSLTEGAISKLKNMTDAEFDELIRENTSDFFDLD